MDCIYLLTEYDIRNDSAVAIFLLHQNIDCTRNITHLKSSTSSYLAV